MKKLFFLIAVVIPLSDIIAQREYLPDESDLEHFYKTKTYIVLSDNPLSEYNFEIQDAVNKYWNITEFEFLKFKDFEEKSKDINGSFLYTAAVSFEKDKSKTRYNFLCLSLGGDYPSLNEMKDIANLPLSYFNVDEDSYTYKLGTFIIFLQNHIKLITENPKMISQNIYKHYNENMADLKGKTLYFVEDDLERSISSEAKIKSLYPGKVKIVEKEGIKKLIMSGDENAVFLHKVGPEGKKLNARVYKILVGAGDSRFYYFDYHNLTGKGPDAFLSKDFQKLAKAQ